MFTFTMALVTCLGLIYNYHVSIFLKGVPDIIDPSLSYLIFRTDDTGKTFSTVSQVQPCFEPNSRMRRPRVKSFRFFGISIFELV